MNKKIKVILIILILLMLVSVSKSMAEGKKNTTEDNANLSELHLQYSGISPNFDKNITEYYFVVSDDIYSINIIAKPEDSNATVIITGNDNIDYGKNRITIDVLSKDKTQIKTYVINVTKTTSLETANANLETLAVRQGEISPEFNNNTTKYTLEIANDVNKIDILAIPQRINSVVTIEGNDEMNVGDNKIEVIVLAEDELTEKTYEIVVHRRTQEEELLNQDEAKNQAQRLSLILSGEDADRQVQNLNQQNNLLKI